MAIQCKQESVKYYKWQTLTRKPGRKIPESNRKFLFRVSKGKLLNYAEKCWVKSCRKLHLFYSKIKWGKEATAFCQRYVESLFGKWQNFKLHIAIISAFYLYNTDEFTELLLSTLYCFSYRKAWEKNSKARKLIHGCTITEDYDFPNCSVGTYSAPHLSFAPSVCYIW